MAKIKVNTDSMKQTDSALENDINKLKKSAKEINHIVTELHQIWEGPKHDYYVKEYDKFQDELNSIIASLQKYEKSYEKTRKKYDRCNSEVASYVNKI